jgi:hypothetical protein
MTAAWIWVRSDLRRRWRSWVVLGVLAGVSVGLACAGVAGARRADRAVPRFAAAADLPDAAILANDPAFDPNVRARIDRLPEVTGSYPFMVSFLLETDRKGLDAPLVPTAPQTVRPDIGALVAGRAPRADRADEIVVNENVRDQFGLDIGSTYTLTQQAVTDRASFPVPGVLPRRVNVPIKQRMRVVGIEKATGDDLDSIPSSGFYDKYRDQLVGFTNEFVRLRRPSDFNRLQDDVSRIMNRPINVDRVEDLFGIRQMKSISHVESTGLLLFSLAVVVGAGALVGQALVRSVSAGASDLATWRAIGADRRIAWRALVFPATITAAVGAVTGVIVAILLSPRFPLALVRKWDLDVGFHADWPVLVIGAVASIAAILGTAWLTAEFRIRRDDSRAHRTPLVARLSGINNLPPALLIGSRLATEPGRGRRAVPVRSALIGAIVGVLGVVGCLTFRSGLTDAVHDPQRSGVVWNAGVAGAGILPRASITAVTNDRAVAAAVDAVWARAIRINDTPTPTFGTRAIKGAIPLVVIDGDAPRNAHEIAFGPTTMKRMHLHVGDIVTVGSSGNRARIVGTALLPETSHTSYDQSAWVTADALSAALPREALSSGDFTEDYLLLRWKPGADSKAALARFSKFAGPDQPFESARATLPTNVSVLGDLRVLPMSLAIFFALLAVATVAHALVTTVRRRRADLAILRSVGFTRRDSRIAIAWQATLLAIAGLVVGVPLGIIVGRLAWRQLANTFPLVYAPPLELVAVIVIIPIALIIANALAVGPAHAATRIRPANVLRSE